MNFIKTMAAVASVAVLLSASMAANAAIKIRITDGVNGVVDIVDNGANDFSGAPGIVSYTAQNTTFFMTQYDGWEIVFTSGSSNFDPLDMHFAASVTSVGPRANVLQVMLTQDQALPLGGPNAGVGPLTFASGNSSGSGAGIGTWNAYVDDAGGAFATTTHLFGGGYGATSASATVPLTGPYSATIVTTFDFRNVGADNNQASFDLELKVPEPAGLALVGVALLGAAVATRRRKV